ncbi:MAG: pyridoxal 5-phosphate synthase glutaminase subunit PdxT [Actinomycetota bacterium]
MDARSASSPTIGVLALQGAFGAHEASLAQLGAATRQVRTPRDLDGCDALVMPGGESTTMSRLLHTAGLYVPLAARIAEGMAVFGTCAGMILLATEVLDGRPDQCSFGAIDLSVRRNGYGRQIDSFEGDIELHSELGADIKHGAAAPFHAVFIRAPRVERAGPTVRVLATLDDTPVLAQQGPVLVASFHPELTNDARLHSYFLSLVSHSTISTTASHAVSSIRPAI